MSASNTDSETLIPEFTPPPPVDPGERKPSPWDIDDTLERAYKLAEDWAGDLYGSQAAHELARFICTIKEYPEDDLERHELLDAATYFIELNVPCDESLPPAAIDAAIDGQISKAAHAQVLPKAARATRVGVLEPVDPNHTDPYDPDTRWRTREPVTSIKYRGDELPAMADLAERALLEDQEHGVVLGRGNCYVTVGEGRATTARQQSSGETGARVFEFRNPAALRERLMLATQVCGWRQQTSAWAPTKAPDDLVQTLLARGGGKAPPLTGILHAPTIAPDGRVIEWPGYDADTGLYAAFKHGDFPALRSFRKDQGRPFARAAYRWLVEDLLGEFTFRQPVDASAAVAAILTALVRPVCGLAPGFMFSSPMQSTGKTTLAALVGVIAEGAAPGLNSWPSDDAEVEKIILSVLRVGQPVLCFDNVPLGAVLRSDKLAKLLTAEQFQGRILGQSEAPTFPTNVTVLLTGNNPLIEGDLATRVIEVYMDPRTERPDQRVFNRDVLEHAKKHRGVIVESALTIIKAYLDSGSSGVGGKGTRFPSWQRLVRDSIIWAGGEDVASKFDRAYEGDSTLAQLREMLTLWRPVVGLAPVTAGDLVSKLYGVGDFDGQAERFVSLLTDLVGGRRGVRLTVQALGKRLKQYVNRPVGELRLVSGYDEHRKQHFWGVETVNSE